MPLGIKLGDRLQDRRGPAPRIDKDVVDRTRVQQLDITVRNVVNQQCRRLCSCVRWNPLVCGPWTNDLPWIYCVDAVSKLSNGSERTRREEPGFHSAVQSFSRHHCGDGISPPRSRKLSSWPTASSRSVVFQILPVLPRWSVEYPCRCLRKSEGYARLFRELLVNFAVRCRR